MQKELTIPTILAVLFGFIVFVALILVFGGDIEPQVRTVGVYLLIGSSFALLGCIRWHFALEGREDIYPDVLSTLVPSNEISEVGSAHISVRFEQNDADFWIVVLAQNLVDASSLLVLDLEREAGAKILPRRVPQLEMVLPPAAVVESRIKMRINDGGELKFKPVGACTPREQGTRVRFARRGVLQSELSSGLWLAGLLAGGMFLLGGTARYIRVSVSKPSARAEDHDDGPPSWQRDILWSPETPETSEGLW